MEVFVEQADFPDQRKPHFVVIRDRRIRTSAIRSASRTGHSPPSLAMVTDVPMQDAALQADHFYKCKAMCRGVSQKGISSSVISVDCTSSSVGAGLR